MLGAIGLHGLALGASSTNLSAAPGAFACGRIRGVYSWRATAGSSTKWKAVPSVSVSLAATRRDPSQRARVLAGGDPGSSENIELAGRRRAVARSAPNVDQVGEGFEPSWSRGGCAVRARSAVVVRQPVGFRSPEAATRLAGLHR